MLTEDEKDTLADSLMKYQFRSEPAPERMGKFVIPAVEKILNSQKAFLAETIRRELVCGCVEESGYKWVKGTTHPACWYAELSARIVEEE